MQLKFCAQKLNMSSETMIQLSRTVRQCREEMEDVRRQLQTLSGLEECRSAILRQEEGAAVLTARIVGLSASLREISELYAGTERRNADSVEERPRPAPGTEAVQTYGTDSELHRRIQNTLYQ